MKRIIEFKSNLYPGHTFHVGLQQPILRTPDQMTEEEIRHFLILISDSPTYDEDTAISPNEMHFEKVIAHPENEEDELHWSLDFTFRCFEGVVGIGEYGTMGLYEGSYEELEEARKGTDEVPSMLPIFYQTQAVDYLRSIGIDCDGLLSNGLAIKDDRPAWIIEAEAKLSA